MDACNVLKYTCIFGGCAIISAALLMGYAAAVLSGEEQPLYTLSDGVPDHPRRNGYVDGSSYFGEDSAGVLRGSSRLVMGRTKKSAPRYCAYGHTARNGPVSGHTADVIAAEDEVYTGEGTPADMPHMQVGDKEVPAGPAEANPEPESVILRSGGSVEPGNLPTTPGLTEAGPDGSGDDEPLTVNNATLKAVLREHPYIMSKEWAAAKPADGDMDASETEELPLLESMVSLLEEEERKAASPHLQPPTSHEAPRTPIDIADAFIMDDKYPHLCACINTLDPVTRGLLRLISLNPKISTASSPTASFSDATAFFGFVTECSGERLEREAIVAKIGNWGLSAAELYALKRLAGCTSLPHSNIHEAAEYLISRTDPQNYSNFEFLYVLLHHPSEHLSFEVIQPRLTPIFLSSLSLDQLVRVLETILGMPLRLSEHGKMQCLAQLFGFINHSAAAQFTPAQTCTIVKAILSSNVPEGFEHVYLTWKMWHTFDISQQQEIAESISSLECAIDRKAFMMLYFFTIDANPGSSNDADAHNSMRRWFVDCYKENYLPRSDTIDEVPLRDMLASLQTHGNRQIPAIVREFGDELIYLPDVLPSIDSDAVRVHILGVPAPARYNAEYSIHFFYAFSKFRSVSATEPPRSQQGCELAFWNKFCCDLKTLQTLFMDWPGRKYCPAWTLDQYTIRACLALVRQVTQDKDFDISMLSSILSSMPAKSDSELLAILLFLLIDPREFSRCTLSARHKLVEMCYSKQPVTVYKILLYNLGLSEELQLYPNIAIPKLLKVAFYTTPRELAGNYETYLQLYPNIAIPKLLKVAFYTTPRELAGNYETYLRKWITFNPEFKLFKSKMLAYWEFLVQQELGQTAQMQALRDLFWSDYYNDIVRTVSFTIRKDIAGYSRKIEFCADLLDRCMMESGDHRVRIKILFSKC